MWLKPVHRYIDSLLVQDEGIVTTPNYESIVVNESHANPLEPLGLTVDQAEREPLPVSAKLFELRTGVLKNALIQLRVAKTSGR